MKKLNGVTAIFTFIKLILKYAAYVSIVIEIANFALEKINPLLNISEPLPNEQNNATTGQPTND